MSCSRKAFACFLCEFEEAKFSGSPVGLRWENHHKYWQERQHMTLGVHDGINVYHDPYCLPGSGHYHHLRS